VRRETSEEETEQADIETERVIRVVAPSDVQFQLSQDGKDEEVVINTNSVPAESLCIDTAAFVGNVQCCRLFSKFSGRIIDKIWPLGNKLNTLKSTPPMRSKFQLLL
jgi:hypothetical protein